MNKKIFFARLAIGLALISFVIAFVYGIEIFAFMVFSAGCIVYSLIALSFFRKNINDIMSAVFFGSFMGMFVVLVIHTLFLVMTITLRGDWGEGFQFLLTLYGIIPAMIAGSVLGGIFEFIEKRFSITLAYFVTAILIIVPIALLVKGDMQRTSNIKAELMHRNGQNADGTFACDTFLHEDYQLISCYIEEARATGSTKQCISGVERSLSGMTDCLFAAAQQSKNASVCEYFANNPQLEKYLGYAPSYQDADPQLLKQHRLVYVEAYKTCLGFVNDK